MDISVIIVNFRSKKFLFKCISSLNQKFKGFSWEVMIVNNDAEKLNDAFFKKDNIRVFNMSSNQGFGKACNYGANAAKGKILFFLNPDTEIIKFDINILFKEFNSHKAGIVSPLIRVSSGNIQHWTTGNKISLWRILKTKLGLQKDNSFDNKTEFDWVSGAAFFIPRKLFFESKGFDKNFFMYFEDIDLCLRIKSLGYKIIRLNELEILHIGGQSYNNKKTQKRHYYTSQDYYFQKHFGITTVFMLKILRKFFLILK